MKVKARKEFEWIIDSTIGRARINGEVFDVNEERASILIEKGLVTALEEAQEKPKRRRKNEIHKEERDH